MSNKPVIQGGKSDKPRTPIEAANTLKSVGLVRILDLVSEGEIVGFADGTIKSVYLDETPIENADGSRNFNHFTIDWRHGTPDQDYIAGFPSVENELGIGVELKYATPYERSFTNLNLNAVRVRLSVGALHSTNVENGDIKGTGVSYTIAISTDNGPFKNAVTGSFAGKTMSKFERDHRIDLPPATIGWVIRVSRTTPDSTKSALVNPTFVESMVEIIDAKLRYPNSAIIAVSMDAEQFKSIPSRSYDLKGRIIKVPSNYNPETRVYTGVWDGTFKPAWTDNPAWIYYDLVLHPRYGLGHLLDESHINKWALYRIAQYCDELVPDGRGGMEPRFTCNLYLQRQAEAYKVIQDLATVFRGIAYWAGGQIMAVADMPEDPVYTYTPANVIDGKFTYQGSSSRTRHTVALTSWSDQANFGRQVVEYVDDPDGVVRYGIQQTDLTAIGCTSRGQAQRMGRYTLMTSIHETQSVSFAVGMDGTLVAPGKIIRIADPLRANHRMGGRIKVVTDATTVTLDGEGVINATTGDELTIIKPDGQAETRTIASITDRVVTVSPAFSAAPIVGSVWAIDSSTIATQRYRVISVTEERSDETMFYAVNAVEHNPSKFGYVDSQTSIDVPDIRDDHPVSTQVAPAALILSHFNAAAEVDTTTTLTIDWPQTPGAVAYLVEYRVDEDDWIKLPRITGTTVDVPKTWHGTYVARIRAVSVNGIVSAYRESAPYVIAENVLPPKVVTKAQEDIIAVADGLAAEEAARIAADTAEVNARAAAILQEQTDRASAIAAEAAARTTAINNEAATRAAAVTDLQNDVDVLQAQVGDIMQADEHNSTNTYATGELVKSGGKLYRALQPVPAGIAITDTLYWDEIGTYASLGEAVSATVGRVDVAEQRITSAEGTLSSVNTTVTAQGTRLTNAEGTILTHSTAIQSIDQRTTATETEISAINNDITSLETVVAGKASVGALDALTTRVTSAEGTITAQGQQITALDAEIDGKASATAVDQLTTRVTEVEGEVTALSQASTDLTSRVGTMEGALTNEIITSANKNASFTASINNLSSRMTDAEGDIVATSGALNTLTTRVTNAEGTITSHSSQLTSLQSQVDAIDADTGGAGAAISALDARVTATEQDIDTMSSQITSLQNSVTSANKIYAQPTAPPTAGGTNNDLWFDTDDGNKPYTLLDGAWVPRKFTGVNRIFIQPNQPVAENTNDLWFDSDDGNKPYRWNGTSWLDISDARTTANASAISSLTSRVTTAEGNITSQSSAITTLQNSVNNPTTGLSATASAVSALDTRVDTAEGNITSQASSISSLTTTVNGHTATISTHAQSIDGLKAQWNLTLDVNGYVSGLSSINNGTKADFTILADNFYVIAPGQAKRRLFSVDAQGTKIANDLYMGTGRIISDTGTYMKVQGTGFGTTNQFVEWYGPKMAIASCSESNAIYYLKTNGAAYFGGALSSGVLKNAATSTQVSTTASVETGMFGSNGSPKTLNVDFSYTRLSAAFNGDVASSHNGVALSATIVLERSINGGAWTQIGTYTATGTTEATYDYEMNMTYVNKNFGGGWTTTDNNATVGNFNYRLRITAASGGWPIISQNGSGGWGSQRLGVISVEE